MSLNLYWLGPVVEEFRVDRLEAISPAANSWQTKFLCQLKNLGCDVVILTYAPEPLWPKGRLWVKYGGNKEFEGMECIGVPYLNLYIIKKIWIASFLAIKTLFRKKSLLITYNPVLEHRLYYYIIKPFKKISWISIVADDEARGLPLQTIFLSHDYYTRFKGSKQLFYGGVEDNFDVAYEPKKNIIMYAGSLSKWTGIEDFAEKFSSISRLIDVELHIYGKGTSEKINYLSMLNEKIKFYGYVDSVNLNKACAEAFAFINPRPLHVTNGDNNFPSKLLLYLSYGRPVISTRTRNLPADFDSILEYYDPDSIDSIHDVLVKVLSMDDINIRIDAVLEFQKERSWRSNVEGLIDDIKTSANTNN